MIFGRDSQTSAGFPAELRLDALGIDDGFRINGVTALDQLGSSVAISRDLNYGYKFLEEFQNKLLFGTDICHVGQEAPIVDYFRQGLKEGKISKIVYDKTTEENAKRVLGLAVDP